MSSLTLILKFHLDIQNRPIACEVSTVSTITCNTSSFEIPAFSQVAINVKYTPWIGQSTITIPRFGLPMRESRVAPWLNAFSSFALK